MRWLLALFLMVACSVAQADEVFLIPVKNPKAIYPKALLRAGMIGDVRASFLIKADGSVNNVRIIESDHPDFSAAVAEALSHWQFKSWAVETDKPAELEIIIPMDFRFDAPDDINQWLKELSCAEVNTNLANYPEYEGVDMAPFHYVRGYLNNTFYQKQLSTEQRLALVSLLNQRATEIIGACQKHPTHKYAAYLPEEIRRLL
jgi:TonB family protein